MTLPTTPTDPEITTFIEALSPDHFLDPPTEQTHIRVVHEIVNVLDAGRFTEFWQRNLAEVLHGESYFAALHTGTHIMYYDHRPGESHWDFAIRLRDDAERVGAKWAFACHPGRGAIGDAGGTDVTSEGASERLAPHLKMGAVWYATGARQERKFGMLLDGQIVSSSNPKGASPHFLKIDEGIAS